MISQQELDDAVSEYTAWEGRDSQSRAEVERLEFAVDRLVVRAPFDGTVVATFVENFEFVQAQQPIIRMLAGSTMRMIG